MAEGSRGLQMWLGANVSESYRAPVLAVADCLEDLRSSDLDELESVLALNSWPVLTRRRFIDAWRELKGEGAAVAPAAPMDVEAPEPVAEAAAEPAAAGLSAEFAVAPTEDGALPPDEPPERSVGGVSALSRAVEGRPARGDAYVAAPMKPPTDE